MLFFSKNKNNKGFTLIELLVVVSIIGVLASVVLTSLNSARSKARNVRRNEDIRQLLNAFHLGFTSAFPGTGGTDACVSSSCNGIWSGISPNGTVDAYLAPYMPSKPSDPSSNWAGYVYNSSWSGTSPYDGYVFPAGPILTWLVESPVSSTSCGSGRIYSASASFIQCMLEID